MHVLGKRLFLTLGLDLKFNNYFKEIYLDSDTKIALISSSPSEITRRVPAREPLYTRAQARGVTKGSEAQWCQGRL